MSRKIEDYDGQIIVENGKRYSRCAACGKVVCLDKIFFGDFHFCVGEEETGPSQKFVSRGNNELEDYYSGMR